jgi:2-polyprenyl-3-methyl-5-hydroxy-6-metoxy-1,4-benzoquinol methylase
MDESFRRFVQALETHGYTLHVLGRKRPVLDRHRAYLRHDVPPGDLDFALRLAALHERLGIPGSFHLAWDMIEGHAGLERAALRLRAFDPQYVQFGLQCDPISAWLVETHFDRDESRLAEFLRSPDFAGYLAEMLAALREQGGSAPAVRAVRDGAWGRLIELDRSFRQFVGECTSISGRGSPLSNAFFNARTRRPEFAAIAAWFSSIDFLANADLSGLGYAYEATRAPADGRPGSPVIFGGAEMSRLREALRARLAGGGGFIAIFPAKYWDDGRYADLAPPLAEGPPASPALRNNARSAVLDAAMARLQDLVRDTWIARGEDPDSNTVTANIAYNSTGCRHRAATLLAHVERAYGFSMRGKAVCELGAGFGGLCLHWAVEHGAARILAVDQAPYHVEALRAVLRDFGLPGFITIEADLQTYFGHDESMDLVVLNDVLYTSNLSPDQVAAACARVLRPRGIVLFRHVNRAHGPSVASHRDGTQFLDPDSADRAARFAGRGSGSTLAHRPLSPWGLAAFLRQAGFDDFCLDDDMDARDGGANASRGLRLRYLLAGRKSGIGPRPLRRMAPPPDGVLDLAPFCAAVTRASVAVHAAAEKLRGLFGGGLCIEIACAELHGYLIDRLLMDGLVAFRGNPRDLIARSFANAIDRALDHALVAVLTRHAGWGSADFTSADPEGLARILKACLTVVRRGFRQPAGGTWLKAADWDGMAARFVSSVVPDNATDPRGRARAASLLRAAIADHLRLHAVGLLARTADPVAGSIEQEYVEASVDRIEAEIRAAVGAADNGPRPVCREALTQLIEDIETDLAPRGGITVRA